MEAYLYCMPQFSHNQWKHSSILYSPILIQSVEAYLYTACLSLHTINGSIFLSCIPQYSYNHWKHISILHASVFIQSMEAYFYTVFLNTHTIIGSISLYCTPQPSHNHWKHSSILYSQSLCNLDIIKTSWKSCSFVNELEGTIHTNHTPHLCFRHPQRLTWYKPDRRAVHLWMN